MRLVGAILTMEVDAAFHNGSVDQFWQSHMLEVHDSMGPNPIGTTNFQPQTHGCRQQIWGDYLRIIVNRCVNVLRQ